MAAGRLLSGRGPGWPKGTLGGMGASFLETESTNQHAGLLSGTHHPSMWL